MTAQVVCMAQDGSCAKVSEEALSVDVAEAGFVFFVTISGSVGLKGRNAASDVRTIQSALNDISPSKGGPIQKLAVDGISGPKTRGAIQNFQKTFMTWPDMRVDPGGKTLGRINDARYKDELNKRSKNLPNPRVVPLVLGLLPNVRRCILAADSELLMALPVFHEKQSGGGPLLDRDTRMKRINLHFDIDRFPTHRSTFFNNLIATFRDMSSVLARGYETPESGLLGVFVPNTIAEAEKKGWRAYTFSGGFRAHGEIWKPWGIRRDRIYICSALELFHHDFRVMSVLHELAHFVGGVEVHSAIEDYGKGWVDSPEIKKLMPWQKTLNAQSYANFSFHCGFNRSPFGEHKR